MVYTIKIEDKTDKARSIINMLMALQEDYDFIEITESEQDQDEVSFLNELEARYNAFIKNEGGKDWDVLMKEITKTV